MLVLRYVWALRNRWWLMVPALVALPFVVFPLVLLEATGRHSLALLDQLGWYAVRFADKYTPETPEAKRLRWEINQADLVAHMKRKGDP